jgi:uncharacterized membrane protein
MIQEASVTGLVRTVLIIIGVIFLLRLLGRVMMAKREMEKENHRRKSERAFENERKKKLKNFGKVTISKKSKPESNEDYVDFEEVD